MASKQKVKQRSLHAVETILRARLLQKKSCSIDGKCPNFSLRLYLRMRGVLMLANFGLKIRPF